MSYATHLVLSSGNSVRLNATVDEIDGLLEAAEGEMLVLPGPQRDVRIRRSAILAYEENLGGRAIASLTPPNS